MRWRSLTFASVLCATLAGCGTTRTPMLYQPTVAIQKTIVSAQVTVGSFVDSRGESDPTWAGAIRGGFGNSLKVLALDKPVSDVIKAAFEDGLKARGASPTLTGGQLELTVLDSSGHTKFTRNYRSNNIDGSILTLSTGVFASIDDLRVVMERTLRETVDKALDDSALRAALQI